MKREGIRFLLKIVLGLFYRVKIVGRENIPKHGAALLCANHVGELDMFFIGYRIQRLVRWMAKEELFKNPIVGALIRWVGAFPIKRGKGDVGAIKTVFRLLDDGHIVGIFAEGTRTRGQKAKVNPGIAMFAIYKRVQIIPVGIEGPTGLFSRVRIVIGKPYDLDLVPDKKYSHEEMSEISSGIMEKVYGLLEEK